MDTLIKEVKEQKGLVVAVIALGLIFGFVVGRAIKGKEAGEIIAEKQKAPIAEEVLNNTTSMTNLSTVSVVDNQTAGNIVSVEKVNLTDNAWVVVREDINGEMGNILGAQWLPKGTNSATMVELLRGTVAGNKYYVVLYNDNGDRIFGKDTDTPMKNKGEVIFKTFTVK